MLGRSFGGNFILICMIIIYFVLTFFIKNNIKSDIKEEIGKNIDENYNSFNRYYELIIRAELEKQVIGLGNDGVSVKLTGKAKERGDRRLKEIALNEEVSEQLSYNRTLSDARNPLCKRRKYDLNILPTTSVIIIYYNEPYSVILRTVHSVLRTTDHRILKEIILVDDASTNAELQGKLHYYVKTKLPQNVKILTLRRRVGIVRARLAGARFAGGDILMFMDAHCECNIGWLEPLADRIRLSRTSVLVPIIDSINATDFRYSVVGRKIFYIGGFHWNGHFTWIDIPRLEMERINRECMYEAEICPTHSPTMSGGLFAINRKYFWKIGSYDEQMDGWGGENLEMSFRIWQCGGSIETIPCSRIGHIFRDFHPYKFPKNKDTHGINTVRMAKVWMDEYINLFYMNRPDLKNNPDVGTVTPRKMLREKLECKDFNWYLDNIYPQKFIPIRNVQGYGHVRSRHLCLDDLNQNEHKTFLLGVSACNEDLTTRSQFFSLTKTGVLRREDSCATAKEISNLYYVEVIPCKAYYIEEIWSYSYGNLRHLNTGLCLDSSKLHFNDFVELLPCDKKSETQKWFFEH